jgi:hypothetical protein
MNKCLNELIFNFVVEIMSCFKVIDVKMMLEQELLSAREHNFATWATTLRMVLQNQR